MTKQNILDEIRRVAKENGDAPVGRLRFFTETGIKESDWRGVYWARWNDAIKEAGFAPNKKVEAYDEDWLLTKLADYTRELGRIPTSSEIRLKSRSDIAFPADTTISSRFGNKSKIILRLAEFCCSNKDYQDVFTLCQANSQPIIAPQNEHDELDERIGYVYLFKCGRFYKIGHSNHSGRRERELAIQMPEKGIVVHQIRTDDPVGIEKYWHQRFSAFRKNGEWFDLCALDVKKFKRRRFM